MRRASDGHCATAVCRATRCLSLPSSIRGAKTPLPKPGKASDGSASTRSTCTSSTGPEVVPPGRGRGWSGLASFGAPVQIGVSNFSATELEEVIAAGTTPPVVNQVQFSSLQYRRALLDACRRRSVALEAYSPLGTGRHLSNETVNRVAQRVGRTPAQVLLRWCVQHDLPVISKSTHRERIQENAQIFDFALSNDDMVELDALDHTNGTDRALERKWW